MRVGTTEIFLVLVVVTCLVGLLALFGGLAALVINRRGRG
jgi:hypothetical protein